MADDTEPVIRDVPIGIPAAGVRLERDGMGELEVPADRYWGAQTQRSLHHFAIGEETMPVAVYHAYGLVKKAAAVVNAADGRLPAWKGALIQLVCDEVASGQLDTEFPVSVWQTGSGTQSNMNVNEVVANRCAQLVGAELGSHEPVHPNDDVNMCQSTNDTFPTAMHIAAYRAVTRQTIPAVRRLRDAVDDKARQWADVVKIGRTHLQDATPITVGQEWSAYVGALDDALAELEPAAEGLLALAVGGTAVGTGVNAPADFGEQVCAVLQELTGDAYVRAPNPFTAQATLDRMVRAHAALKSLAVTLFKLANDVRWLGSGPRTGLRELRLPENEPGSSIMPGKVNPTQAEAMLMVCIQVMGADVSVGLAGAEGNFQLNAMRPVLIRLFLHSAVLLGDACDHFRTFLVEGTQLNEDVLRDNIDRSVMMVTALSPHIGYDRATQIAHHAVDHDLTLRQAALALGVPAELFDRVVVPAELTRPSS